MKKGVVVPNGFELVEKEIPGEKERKNLVIRFLEEGKFIQAEEIPGVKNEKIDEIRQLLAEWSVTNFKAKNRKDTISIEEILETIKLVITKKDNLLFIKKRLGVVNGFEICKEKTDKGLYNIEIRYLKLGLYIGSNSFNRIKSATIDNILVKLLDWCLYNLDVENQARSISWLDMTYLIQSEVDKEKN